LRASELEPPIRFLVSDDGTSFVDVIKNHPLCWVHEIRKYILSEVFKRIELETLDRLVKFYKNNVSASLRIKIRSEFE
jgi:hypothetical protein